MNKDLSTLLIELEVIVNGTLEISNAINEVTSFLVQKYGVSIQPEVFLVTNISY